MNFWEILFLFFAFQALLIAFFFFTKKKGDRVANAILGGYLVLFALNLSYNVLYWSELLYTVEFVRFHGILALIWVLYPPLIYLYAKRVMAKKQLGWKDTIHLLPFLFILFSYLPLYQLGAIERLQAFQTGTIGQYIHNGKFLVWITLSVMLFYTVLTYATFKDLHVGLNKKRWFYWVLGSFACYVLAMGIYFVLSRLGLINTKHDYFIMFFIVFFIGAMAYFGFKQPQIFDGLSMDAILPFKKYQKTGLTSQLSQELKNQLIMYFEESRPFLNSELRLNDLAEELNLSRHHTSQIINEHFDTNFFDFVNNYRIEEAKELLSKESSLSITDIIYASGFNNRVSFYKTFKKHTGTTPTDFRLNQSSN